MKLQDYRDDLKERVVKIGTLNGRVRTLEDSKLKVYTIVGVVSFATPILLKALNII